MGRVGVFVPNFTNEHDSSHFVYFQVFCPVLILCTSVLLLYKENVKDLLSSECLFLANAFCFSLVTCCCCLEVTERLLSSIFYINPEESIKLVFHGGVGSSRDHEQLLNERQCSNLEPSFCSHFLVPNSFFWLAHFVISYSPGFSCTLFSYYTSFSNFLFLN